MSSSAYRRQQLSRSEAIIEHLRTENAKFSARFQRIPFDPASAPPGVIEVWRNRDFMAQVYAPKDGGQRISVSRTMIDKWSGEWLEGITWDQLQAVKQGVGFKDRWAVEIYPPNDEVVNVAAMRHLWLLDEAPAFAWRRCGKDQ